MKLFLLVMYVKLISVLSLVGADFGMYETVVSG